MDTVETIHIVTDATRFRLVQLLLEHHYCVKALAKKLGISEPAVSQHMRLLKQHGLVTGVKIGYQTHYQIEKEQLLLLLSNLSSLLSQYTLDTTITKDLDCTCEFVSGCIKRDSKLLEEQGYGR